MSEKGFKKGDELKVDIATPLPPFTAGQVLTITDVKYVETALRGFEGLRVTAVDDNGNEFADMLWLRRQVGVTSKIGAFITVLGKEPAKWIGKKIKVVTWMPKNRKIELLK